MSAMFPLTKLVVRHDSAGPEAPARIDVGGDVHHAAFAVLVDRFLRRRLARSFFAEHIDRRGPGRRA